MALLVKPIRVDIGVRLSSKTFAAPSQAHSSPHSSPPPLSLGGNRLPTSASAPSAAHWARTDRYHLLRDRKTARRRCMRLGWPCRWACLDVSSAGRATRWSVTHGVIDSLAARASPPGLRDVGPLRAGAWPSQSWAQTYTYIYPRMFMNGNNEPFGIRAVRGSLKTGSESLLESSQLLYLKRVNCRACYCTVCLRVALLHSAQRISWRSGAAKSHDHPR